MHIASNANFFFHPLTYLNVKSDDFPLHPTHSTPSAAHWLMTCTLHPRCTRSAGLTRRRKRAFSPTRSGIISSLVGWKFSIHREYVPLPSLSFIHLDIRKVCECIGTGVLSARLITTHPLHPKSTLPPRTAAAPPPAALMHANGSAPTHTYIYIISFLPPCLLHLHCGTVL